MKSSKFIHRFIYQGIVLLVFLGFSICANGQEEKKKAGDDFAKEFDVFNKDISDELVMLDLVTRLIEIFWELLEILCEMAGVDFLELQCDAMKNDKFLSKFITLLPEKVLNKAA